jgi:hypothetical protein
VRAAPGWPAAEELSARRVHVVPDLRSLLGDTWRIAHIEVEGAYLSAQRTRDGRLRVLPALFGTLGAAPAARNPHPATHPLEIGAVVLSDARFEFFDASVRQPPVRLTLERLQARIESLALPALDRPFTMKVDGVVKGSAQHDGRLAIEGRYTVATGDADVQARFTGVDLLAIEPYLLKVSDSGVKRGSLDLSLHATVLRNRLNAPGVLTLTDLELAGGGPLATFAGVPRRAVLAAMSDRGRLEIKFTLDGPLDDPAFSINENLATRIAFGAAEAVGVSVSGAVKGLGSVVKGLFGR